MKERPILFSGPMVRAIQEGRKTQTRRVIAWSNSYVDGQITKFWREHWHELDFSGAWLDDGPSPAGNPGPYLHVPFPPEGTVHRVYPRYQVGDLIWIKETWGRCDFPGTNTAFDRIKILYRADGETDYDIGRWRSARFMPREYARLWLVVKKVRPERLQKISDRDAHAEGITFPRDEIDGFGKAFAALWNSINGKRYPWESNPMVWVYGYERKP